MTQFTEAVQAVVDFAQQPLLTYDAFPASEPRLFQEDCFKNLLTSCQAADRPERNGVLAALTPVIASTPDTFQASRIATLAGVLVEWGADPTIAISAILDRLTSQLFVAAPMANLITPENEAQLFAVRPDAVRSWKSLRYLALPAMTMLCLDFNARQSARTAALLNFTQTLAAQHREVHFLHRLLNLVDGNELIVLHPADTKGFRVRLEAIGSNFHLFSLLQGALVGDPAAGLLAGPRPNRKVLATATGEMPHDRLITDAAVWHYANWTALQPNGTLAPTPVTTWIIGEETPRDIPILDGERIILLGKPTLASRGWDSSFFTNLHDALRSKVEIVEILSADEVALRLRRIHKQAAQGSGKMV